MSAEAVAEELCESVAASLDGKKLPWFTAISSAVQAAMEEALVRILTPTVDSSPILNPRKNLPRKPCVFAYIDTTGDWKATSSVKAACRLQKERKNSVIMVADRDTFRSDTVMQLRRDAWKLQRIPIFEMRHEKDPTITIKKAVQEARDDGSDVVAHAASPKQAATVLATAYLSGAKVILRGVGKPYTGEKHTTRKLVKKLFK
ncbi:signal recognition particle receptor subunit alpha homolog [Malus domestica]|uniref:signal recognition particle receptor subunit alpha homolog n=1 Tax=Malus domestica TaxID=3750 RepID=UPI0010A9D8D9|nr:signal recognition particle receptor subunit alpha homolog [Malus domestica]